MTNLKIHYNNRRVTVSTDNVFAAVTGLKDAALHSPCGGRGTCGKCRAALYDPCGVLKESAPLEGDADLAKYHIPAELAPHCREVLLCRLEITENTACDTVPEIFLAAHEQISAFALTETDGLTLSGGIISQITVTLDTPTKAVPISVTENIKKHTGIPCRNHTIIEETGKYLRNQKNTLTFDLISDGTAHHPVIAGVSPTAEPAYGIAVDIGTTTVAVSLWNLTDGIRIDETGCENPQRSLGSDVISRMSYAEEAPENPGKLKSLITARVASLSAELAERNGVDKNRILYVSAAGNSVMEHMYLGLNTETIARSPFYMETALGYTVSPSEAGLDQTMNPTGRVYLAPLIASYVGGDLSIGAAYLLHKIRKSRDISGENILFMDLGTNGEIGLFSKGIYRFAATAAGPCLEGANIEMGMYAAKGAISRVRFTGEGFDTDVIGDGTPTGICGSGIIDAIAALLESGLLDEYGSLTDEDDDTLSEAVLSHLCEYGDDEKPAVHITPEVVITAGDIRQVQTAKAAIATGVAILLKQAGITADDIDEVYLAGSFGGGINTDAAVRIGLLPNTKCKPVSCGNTSAKGAAAFMLSEPLRNELADVMARSVYTELSADPDFNDLFIDSMLFGQE